MPDIDGLEVCRRLRAAGNRVPVLMLTARDAVEDRIEGLDAGADDYLVKPFDVGELQARLRALLRRTGGDDGGPRALSFGELRLDADAPRRARSTTTFVELTRTEFQLLELLHAQPAPRAQRTTSSTTASGATTSGPSSNALRVYVGYLRRKLEDAGRAAADPHAARRRATSLREP